MSAADGRTVVSLVAEVLAGEGLRRMFGVVGSGNYQVTADLTALGVEYVAARHETGAAVMADVYARSTGEVTAVSLHPGCGLSNAITGIAEAAKSRTPILVLVGETPATQPGSNFAVDQTAMAQSVGALVARVHGAGTAAAETAAAFRLAREERRPVVLNLPLDVQQEGVAPGVSVSPAPAARRWPSAAPREALDQLLLMLSDAERPVFLAGRGAREAAGPLRQLAARTGALLLTSAVARGLFEDDPWSADTMGGFGTPYSQELVRSADLVVVWGASLNRWTTMDGTLLSGATVVQVDDDGSAIDRHQAVDFALIGDVTHVSSDLLEHIAPGVRVGYRTDSVAARLADEGRWSAMPFIDRSTELTIDPRLLTVELDRMLPTSRVVATDVGNFAVWPALYFTVPDRDAYCLPLGFQCVGLGVAAGVGLALARPDRSVIVGVGDGGFLMGIADLETAVRERLPVVYVVYDDEAYGAEMHHFDDGQADVSSVTFPPVDIAGIARGYGAEAVTVRQRDDLDSVATWASGSRERPLVVHAKVTRMPAWMLDHAFAAESKV